MRITVASRWYDTPSEGSMLGRRERIGGFTLETEFPGEVLLKTQKKICGTPATPPLVRFTQRRPRDTPRVPWRPGAPPGPGARPGTGAASGNSPSEPLDGNAAMEMGRSKNGNPKWTKWTKMGQMSKWTQMSKWAKWTKWTKWTKCQNGPSGPKYVPFARNGYGSK